MSHQVFEHGDDKTYVQDNLYIAIHTVEESESNFAQLVGNFIFARSINSLDDFEKAITEGLQYVSAPPEISVAAGFVRGSSLYVKTVGKGEVYMWREGRFGRLIHGNHTAAGQVKSQDRLLFTSTYFSETRTRDALVKLFELPIHSVKEKIEVPDVEVSSSLVLIEIGEQKTLPVYDLNSLTKQEESPEAEDIHISKSEAQRQPFSKMVSRIFQNIPRPSIQKGDNKSMATIAAVVIVVLILIWSVVLGYRRRVNTQRQKEIQAARELITQKLSQSEEISFLNMARSQALISEAHQELNKLKTKIGDENYKEIKDLEETIRQKEEVVTKKEEKTADEFYDLGLDNQKAKGVTMSNSSDSLVILDTLNGTLYMVDVSEGKKSLSKKANAILRSGKLVVMTDEKRYVLTSDGIFEFSDVGDAKKVIERDSEWGVIADMSVFNGNIYLLDTGKNQIYKYVAIEGGFSSKSSYLKVDVDISGATSMSIDSSVYLSFSDHIRKFTSGVNDGFQTEFPDDATQIEKVIAPEGSEKVYAWDKHKGVIYVIGRSGSYERQVQSSVLGKAEDVVVIGSNAYILIGAKVYSLSLQ